MTGTEALVLRAERDPDSGGVRSHPHRTHRRPRLSVERRPLGELAPGHVRVAMIVAGICGTDVHLTRADPETGSVLGSAPLELGEEGRILGHEGVGRIVAVGAGVPSGRIGEIVTFESILTCRTCPACRRGQFNQCRRARLVGLQVDGLFRSIVDLPAYLTHDVTDLASTGDGLAAAACLEPAACAHVALGRAAVRPGDRIVVFGGGPIGLFTAMLARSAFGASHVAVVEPIAFRREFARHSADAVFGVDEFFDETGEVDVVIETSGEMRNVDRVFPRLGAGARVVLLARSGKPLELTHVDEMITNGVALAGSRGHLGGACDDVLRLHRAGRLPLERAVSGFVDGVAGIRRELEAEAPFEERHVKLLARLEPPDER